ncbi:hypothetical protein ON010_g11052 [Phytophthora cinnamomi]|nr:hypothetical protein ON010_g11052 [Phytophthora cinnamomi]
MAFRLAVIFLPRSVTEVAGSIAILFLSVPTSSQSAAVPDDRVVVASGAVDGVLLASADGRMLSPHFVFAGEPDNGVYNEVKTYCEPSVATDSVRTKAWFDGRVMLKWIEKVL